MPTTALHKDVCLRNGLWVPRNDAHCSAATYKRIEVGIQKPHPETTASAKRDISTGQTRSIINIARFNSLFFFESIPIHFDPPKELNSQTHGI